MLELFFIIAKVALVILSIIILLILYGVYNRFKMDREKRTSLNQDNAENPSIKYDYEGYAQNIENGIPYFHFKGGGKWRLATKIEELHEETEVINFNKLNLTHFPEEIFKCKKLIILRLKGNQIAEIPSAIGKYSMLQWLDLGSNKIISLPAEIGELVSLIELNLANNPIAELPREVNQFKRLEILNLSTTPLKTIGEEITSIRSLKQLLLQDAKLKELSPKIGQLTNLRQLVLRDNNLKELSPKISQLTNLKYLDLIDNDLVELPREIGALKKLEWLLVSVNQLNSLPPEINGLINLVDLSIAANKLAIVPSEIGTLKKLERLTLNNNNLSYLPKEIGQLTNLRALYCVNNQLKSLPFEIGNLTALSRLELSKNQLEVIPTEIGQLESLTYLELNSNKIKNIPDGFKSLNKLERLNFSNNEIEELTFSAKHLLNLYSIDFSFNKIKNISPQFCQNNKIKELNLKENQLETLPPEIGQLVNLEVLNIEKNKLTDLPPEMSQLLELRSLGLFNNELTSLPIEFDNLSKLSGFILRGNKQGNITFEIGKLKADGIKRAQDDLKLSELVQFRKANLSKWKLQEINLNIEQQVEESLALQATVIQQINWSEVLNFGEKYLSDDKKQLEKFSTYIKEQLVKDLVTFEAIYGYKGNKNLILCLLLSKMFWYTELDLGKQNGFLYCGMDLVTVEDLTISNLEKFLQSVPDFTKIISSHPIVGRDGMGGVYFCSFVDNPGPNIFYWDHDFDDFSVVPNDWQSILESKQLSWLLELSQIIGETVSSFTSSPPPKLTTPVPPQVLGAIYSFGEYITELNKSVFTQKGFTVYGVNIENNQIKELLQDKESEYYKYSYVSASINAEIVHNYHSYFLSNNLHLLQELLTVTKEIKGGLYQVIRHIFVELLAGKPNYGHLSYEMIEKISKEGKLPYSL